MDSRLVDCIRAGTGDVSCLGTIVDLVRPDPDSTRPLVLRLDDGTGTIECVQFRPGQDARALKIGDDVVVYGAVQVYRDAPQVRVERLARVLDPNLQTLWINQVIYCKKQCWGSG